MKYIDIILRIILLCCTLFTLMISITVNDLKFVIFLSILSEILLAYVNVLNTKKIIRNGRIIMKYDDIPIYMIDTAYVSINNIFSTSKEIIISDNVYNLLSYKERNALIIHEKCHIKKSHLFKISIAKSASKLLGFITISIIFNCKKPKIILFFVLIWFISISLVYILMHFFEYTADRYSVYVTGEYVALISAITKLSNTFNSHSNYLAIDNTHPKYKKRITNIKKIKIPNRE